MSSLNSSKPIGGYFELGLRGNPSSLNDVSGVKFNSARVAFLQLLKSIKPKKIFLPNYLCDSMIAPVKLLNINIEFYSIDFHFEPLVTEVNDSEYLLYVNYFGVAENILDKIIAKFGADKIIADYSQSYFCDRRKVMGTIYSPRKFFGVPDGGIIYTDVNLERIEAIDKGSIARMQHMLTRLDQGPEAGYNMYQAAEKSLCDLTPLKMSNITSTILNSYDQLKAKENRKRNFNYLFEALSCENELDLNNDIPAMVYPFLKSNNAKIKQKLTSHRIYPATYWPDVLSRVSEDTLEYYLVNNLLAIPCDQRYSIEDMERIISIIKKV